MDLGGAGSDMPKTWEFVYCSNQKCHASKTSPNGESWRFVHKGVLNCTKCTRAFDLHKNVRRHTGYGGNWSGNSSKQRNDWGMGASQPTKASKPTSEDIEQQNLRKMLATQFKNKGISAEEIQARVDEIVPPKPLSMEERKQQIEDKLQKATTRHTHEAGKYTNMYQASIEKGRALLAYHDKVQTQKETAEAAKDEMQKIQLERDQLHSQSDTASAATPSGRASLDGIIAREIAAQRLADDIPPHVASGLIGIIQGILKCPDLKQLVQGGPQHQQQQQQQQVQDQQQQVVQQAGEVQRQQQQVVSQQSGGGQQEWVFGSAHCSLQPLALPPSLQPAAAAPAMPAASAAAPAAPPAAPAATQTTAAASSISADDMQVERRKAGVRTREDVDDRFNVDDSQENKRLMLSEQSQKAEYADMPDGAVIVNSTHLATKLAELGAAADGQQAVHDGDMSNL